MARLSREHFRAGTSTSTPKSSRPSGRLRDIFKPRRSDSSTSSNTITKSQTIGFEPVGILPSERELLYAAAKEEAGVIDGEVKTPVEPEGSVSGQVEDIFGGCSDVQTASTGVITATGSDVAVAGKTEVESTSALPTFSPIQDDFLADQDSLSRQKSIAFNIFDDKDSLSAGIREYVESKIAHAFSAYRCGCPACSSVNVTAKAEVHNSGNASCATSPRKILQGAEITLGRKTIGPYTIDNTFASNAQIGIVALYLLLLFGSAFVGPKAFLLTIWRIGVAMITYTVVCRFCH